MPVYQIRGKGAKHQHFLPLSTIMIRGTTAVSELQARELAFRLQLCRTVAVEIRGIIWSGLHVDCVCITTSTVGMASILSKGGLSTRARKGHTKGGTKNVNRLDVLASRT